MNNKAFDPNKFKAAQVKSWDSVADGWKKWWSTFERITKSVTGCLIDIAEIKPNQSVLDIATGIGEPALTVAQKVGSGGKGNGDRSITAYAGNRKRACTGIRFIKCRIHGVRFRISGFSGRSFRCDRMPLGADVPARSGDRIKVNKPNVGAGCKIFNRSLGCAG